MCLLAGYSQGNPLRVWLYILAVDPLLRPAAQLEGVRRVFGFCDDWTISLDSLACARQLTDLLNSFEEASGQRINYGKSVWMPNRELSPQERFTFSEFWVDPVMKLKHKSLGFWF